MPRLQQKRVVVRATRLCRKPNPCRGGIKNATPFFSAGFTMVEIVIMLGIIVVISSIVLANFPSVSGSINVQKSAQGFALTLRQAQNQALAVRVVQAPYGPVIPPAIGVYISSAAPTSYILFADMNLNKMYDPATDIVIQTVPLEPNVSVYAIQDEAGGSQGTVNIVFAAPEASATIYNASGPIGASVLVKFRTAAGGLIRSVRAWTSGQIAIE